MKKIFEKIKIAFKKQNNKIFNEIESIKNFDFSKLCSQCFFKEECDTSCEIKISNKKTFIIVDDNRGILLIIKDLLDELHKEGKINLDEWNIVSFEGKMAAMFLLKNLFNNNLTNVKAALIDLNYGNILKIDNHNVKINGLHLLYFLKDKFKNMKFYFYTGNTLNPYIKTQSILKDFFKKNFKDNINKYVINKINTSDKELKEKLIELMKDENV